MPDSVAVDLDGTLTDGRYVRGEPIPPPSAAGLRLLTDLKSAGHDVVLYTGRISEDDDADARARAVRKIMAWMDEHDLHGLISRVWPWPKPTGIAFVDDRAVRWNGFMSRRVMDEVARAGRGKSVPSVLLLAPLSDRYSGVGNYGAPALGVYRVAANVRAAGMRADVWDCNVGPEIPRCETPTKLVEAFMAHLEAQFRPGEYDWIGFSILNDTLPLSLGLANLVKKKYPRARMVAGNAEATLNYQDVLDKAPFDCVLVGEADASLPRLLAGDDPTGIPGCIWFTRGNRMTPAEFNASYEAVKWAEIPYRDYALKTAALYGLTDFVRTWIDDRRLMAREETGKNDVEYKHALRKLQSCCTVRLSTMDHCPLSCTYCSTSQINNFATGKFANASFMKIGDVAATFLRIKREVPWTLAIYDDSDETFLGTRRGLEYAAMLAKIKPEMDAGLPTGGFRYLVQTRTNEMTEDLVNALADAGVEHLSFGVENASAYVRDSLRKRQDDKKIVDLIGWCRKRGVTCYYLMILFPPETRIEDLETNVRVVGEWIRLGARVSVEPYLMPYRGAPLMDDPRYTYAHVAYDVPFSGPPTKRLKWPTLVWPRDPDVRGILRYYFVTVDAAIRYAQKKVGHAHLFKGETGKTCIAHLGWCLDMWHTGQIRPWCGEPDFESTEHAVYQEYGDQASGVDVRAAAESAAQSPIGRFNSTHVALDVAGMKPGALKSRAEKDPASERE